MNPPTPDQPSQLSSIEGARRPESASTRSVEIIHPAPQAGLRWLLALLAAAGFGCSMLLANMQVLAPDSPLMQQLCSPSATVDCGAVVKSRYSSIGPVSAPFLGLTYFLLMLSGLTIAGLPNKAGLNRFLLVKLFGLFGLAISVWYLYVMFALLSYWCPWCVVTHVLNFMLVGGLFLAGRRAADIDGPARPTGTALGISAFGTISAALLVILGLMVMVENQTAKYWKAEYLKAVNNADYIHMTWSASPHYEIPIRPDDTTFGRADAPHTIVLFFDYECSVCQVLDRALGNLLTRFPGEVRIVEKHYPLCSSCNPLIPTDHPQACKHQFACGAAEAVEAVRIVGGAEKAAEFHKLMFLNAGVISDRPYEKFAEQCGIALAEYREALKSPLIQERIDEDVALAKRMSVAGSGVIFLDGRQLKLWDIKRNDDPSKQDVEASLALWERLLNSKSVSADQ